MAYPLFVAKEIWSSSSLPQRCVSCIGRAFRPRNPKARAINVFIKVDFNVGRREKGESAADLAHNCVKIGSFGNCLVHLSLMVVVVRQRVVDFCRIKRRKLTQDLFNRQSTTLVSDNGTHRKAASPDNRPSPLNMRMTLNVGMTRIH